MSVDRNVQIIKADKSNIKGFFAGKLIRFLRKESAKQTKNPDKKKYVAASLWYSPKNDNPSNSLNGIKNSPTKNKKVYMCLSVIIPL